MCIQSIGILQADGGTTITMLFSAVFPKEELKREEMIDHPEQAEKTENPEERL
jgi:hypothetical protein